MTIGRNRRMVARWDATSLIATLFGSAEARAQVALNLETPFLKLLLFQRSSEGGTCVMGWTCPDGSLLDT